MPHASGCGRAPGLVARVGGWSRFGERSGCLRKHPLVRGKASWSDVCAGSRPSPGPGSAFPGGYRAYTGGRVHGAHGSLFFIAYEPSAGYEPWVTDGTSSGTRSVGDLYPGSAVVQANDITSTASGTALALQSPGDGGDGDDFSGSLWFTTATAESPGTLTPLVDWGPRFATTAIRFGNDALVWITDYQQTTELWRTDGTTPGTRLVKGGLRAYGSRVASIGNRVFYTDGQDTLAVTDGTTEGTHRLHTWDANVQYGSVLIYRLATAGGLAFLMVAAPRATGAEMWVSDGTPRGHPPVDGHQPRAIQRSPSLAHGHGLEDVLRGRRRTAWPRDLALGRHRSRHREDHHHRRPAGQGSHGVSWSDLLHHGGREQREAVGERWRAGGLPEPRVSPRQSGLSASPERVDLHAGRLVVRRGRWCAWSGAVDLDGGRDQGGPS